MFAINLKVDEKLLIAEQSPRRAKTSPNAAKENLNYDI
jgi:hypothetical protein